MLMSVVLEWIQKNNNKHLNLIHAMHLVYFQLNYKRLYLFALIAYKTTFKHAINGSFTSTREYQFPLETIKLN